MQRQIFFGSLEGHVGHLYDRKGKKGGTLTWGTSLRWCQVRKQNSAKITACFHLFVCLISSPSMGELQRQQAGEILELLSAADAIIIHLWSLMDLLPGEALFILLFFSSSLWRLIVVSVAMDLRVWMNTWRFVTCLQSIYQYFCL